MLNLFAYTCTASVYVAAGGGHTTSVDLSKTYLDWGEAHFEMNDLSPAEHIFVRADVTRFLQRSRDTWDVIFLNPPSFSRSKAMREDLLLERDHGRLVDLCVARLAPSGALWFTTHAKQFELDPRLAKQHVVREITRRVVPTDYQRSPFRAWVIERDDSS